MRARLENAYSRSFGDVFGGKNKGERIFCSNFQSTRAMAMAHTPLYNNRISKKFPGITPRIPFVRERGRKERKGRGWAPIRLLAQGPNM